MGLFTVATLLLLPVVASVPLDAPSAATVVNDPIVRAQLDQASFARHNAAMDAVQRTKLKKLPVSDIVPPSRGQPRLSPVKASFWVLRLAGAETRTRPVRNLLRLRHS